MQAKKAPSKKEESSSEEDSSDEEETKPDDKVQTKKGNILFFVDQITLNIIHVVTLHFFFNIVICCLRTSIWALMIKDDDRPKFTTNVAIMQWLLKVFFTVISDVKWQIVLGNFRSNNKHFISVIPAKKVPIKKQESSSEESSSDEEEAKQASKGI